MSDDDLDFGMHEVTVDIPTAKEKDPGMVLKWRRRGERLEGLVVRETGGRLITEWLPAVVLRPLSQDDSAGEADAAVGSEESNKGAL